MNRSLIVVALGGNAISRRDEEGNVAEQFENSRVTAESLTELVEAGNQLVITHGNGPQIGNFLLRNEAAADVIYPLPMEVAAAHVQGGMGFMIAQTLMNALHARQLERVVTTFITTVLVEPNDPSFRDPTKPIGTVLDKAAADRFRQEEGWTVKEMAPGEYRRVVPSPAPQRIVEIEAIRRAVEAGDVIVACGGGGIPVVWDDRTGFRGIRAVIDKDLASALLATELHADAMLILTDVDQVLLDYGTDQQRPIDRMTVDQARRWLQEGQFPAGSMGPKVQAAVNFLQLANEDARVLIGPLDRASNALAGQTGTQITMG